MGLRGRGVEIKTPEQIELMRSAGLVVGETLALVRSSVRAGMTTGDLDRLAEVYIRDQGAVPSFKGYHGFPGSLCLSVNDEVVHGIPGGRVLLDGDVLSVDCGAIVQDWHGDAAVTLGIGEINVDATRLLEVCEASLWAGLAAARLGGRVTDISHAIEAYVRSHGEYGVLEDYVGHGIGSSMHMPPNVPNHGPAGKGPKLVPGLALAVEPMITTGSIDTQVLEDDWTVVTDDGSLAAHFEHTFTLTERGAWVLTALDGGQARLAELGVPYGGPGA
ncbi:MAG: type I methionyl aminopeptidase [Nocardioidaceae bacterium]|jgi:methionyl aminopeptidase|nr:type I methionyl aminopeptidase [Nocardioidaceae bacterium]